MQKLRLSPSRRDAGHKRLPLIAAAFVALVCVAIVALSAWREWASRDAALQNAEVDVANLAQSLSQQAGDTFELADTILIGLVNRLETDGTGSAARARLKTIVDLRKATMTRLRGLFVYDKTGRWLVTTEDCRPRPVQQQRPRLLQAPSPVGRHKGADRQSRQEPLGWAMGNQVSRRFNHPDGSFAGVVLATINSAYFAQFYRQFDLGPNGRRSVDEHRRHRAGAQRRRQTSISATTCRTRRSSGSSGRGPSAGAYSYTSTLDGVRRLSFYKVADRYPILVLATKAREDAPLRLPGAATPSRAWSSSWASRR